MTRSDRDEALLPALYDQYAMSLWSFVVRLTGGDRARSQDVVQETMLRPSSSRRRHGHQGVGGCQWIGATTWSASDPQKVYRQVVVPRGGGAPQNVAQWAVRPGQEADVVGSTDLSPDRIQSIELQAVADGSVLLRAQPSAGRT